MALRSNDFGLEMVRKGLCRASRFKKGHPRFRTYRDVQKEARKRWLGKTRAQVLASLGEPAEKSGDTWKYPKALGRGMHSFRFVTELTFEESPAGKRDRRRE